jgi:TonB family protein
MCPTNPGTFTLRYRMKKCSDGKSFSEEVVAMNYDHPLYHQSPPSVLDRYATRILLGLACSLATVLLLLNIPFSTTTERVGWSTRPSEQISLTQVQETETTSSEETDDTRDRHAGAPPPTPHAPSAGDAAADKSTGDADEQEKGSSEERKEDESRTIRSITALSTKDKKPEIVGGRGSLYLNIRYPQAAREKGIEGLLTLTFTVDENGNARRIDVTKSLHPLCDSAAVEALQTVKFRPGIQNGEPIPVRMSLPVRFQIQSTSKAQEKTLQTKRLPNPPESGN